VEDGVSEPEYKPAFEPDLVVRIDLHTFLSLISGWLEPTDAIEIGRLDVENDPDALVRVGKIFSLPPA
jgi:putative sterol carrier protein